MQQAQSAFTMIAAGGAELIENALLMRTDVPLLAAVNAGKIFAFGGQIMFGAWVTTNLSQRTGKPLVYLPAQVTFILSQLGTIKLSGLWFDVESRRC
jgi:hypothetical protein